MIHECPRLWQSRRDFFPKGPPTSDMRWSVRTLLDFSYIPCVNAAFEGTWAHADPLDQDDLATTLHDSPADNSSEDQQSDAGDGTA